MIKFKRVVKLTLILLMFIPLSLLFNKKDLNANTNNEISELRAFWITPITGDISKYQNENQFKNEMNEILDVAESYNMNAIMFHIRTHNNALYKSTLNPKAKIFENVNFDSFDPLEWLIKETKSRGFEFHAWLNPYRVSKTQYVGSLPNDNPESNSNNILSYNGLSILNPGLPEVRDFVLDTVNEIVSNYDVDAIHFDDYFYINLGSNGSNIITESDQDTFLEHIGNFSNTNSGKADWRREQVNLMVEKVHTLISDYNLNNDSYIQFGISPTGIYKNGNGNVSYDSNGHPVTNGSNTRGQTHYSSYLFSDSLNWIKNGWLDYILPQSYWATNHNVASYHEVMGWWNKVVKNYDVNLYSGIGLYMATNANAFDWYNNENEMSKQLDYLSNLENANGFSIFTYRDIRNANNNKNSMLGKQLNNALNNNLKNIAVLPEINTMEQINLGKVKNVSLSNDKITWNNLDDAKSYYIYRSKDALNFSSEEIIKVIGGNAKLEINYDNDYIYGIRSLSKSNTLGEKTNISSSNISALDKTTINYSNDEFNSLTFYGEILNDIEFDHLGFYVAYGELSLSELKDYIENDNLIHNDKTIFKQYVKTLNENEFFINLSNIPEENYLDLITVIPFYEYNEEIYLSNNKHTSSIFNTALNNNDLDIINLYEDDVVKLYFNSFDQLVISKGLYELDLKELEKEFVSDWNEKFDVNFTNLDEDEFYSSATIGLTGALNLNYDLSNGNLYKFFNDNKYEDKWGWLLDLIKEVDGTVHPTRQIDAIKSNGTLESYELYYANHLIYAIYNFFNQSQASDGYPAIDFTDNKKYETLTNHANKISIINANNYLFYDINNKIIMPNLSNGFNKYQNINLILEPLDEYDYTKDIIFDLIN